MIRTTSRIQCQRRLWKLSMERSSFDTIQHWVRVGNMTICRLHTGHSHLNHHLFTRFTTGLISTLRVGQGCMAGKTRLYGWPDCVADKSVWLTGLYGWQVCMAYQTVWLTRLYSWQVCMADKTVWQSTVWQTRLYSRPDCMADKSVWLTRLYQCMDCMAD